MPGHLNGGPRGWIVDLAVAALTVIALVISLFVNSEKDPDNEGDDNTDLKGRG